MGKNSDKVLRSLWKAVPNVKQLKAMPPYNSAYKNFRLEILFSK